ncbi:poly(3-hydroxybutyrate) depolymerase [Zhongshania antarctica]|jgi:poly(3-hydroxybutyrate) depolymerase|uniref:Poly(3-hydroxybutyrate) depolymerase n=1 Tax=Zhongshania antarctica TaxID=641702 RepID=A0A840R5J8_9GAMM|nr:polyhydroxyalkanoate depolymerase [Zhongshania antarctica]MBB5187854.1 poly(3-hydroxybutyrate) depolymerase [Zhongshania antarctica]
MRYHIADATNQSLNTIAIGLSKVKTVVDAEWNPVRQSKLGRFQSALLDTSIRVLQHYPKKGWDYDDVIINSRAYPVAESIELERPFCKLMKFRRQGLPKTAPRVIFVAALSGHHATLSRETFEEFLPEHEVYVTDWTDARLVPVEEGRFGFEEYIAYLIEFMEKLGPGTHMVGLCQAGIPGLVTASVMSAQENPARPASMSFLGSPMDIRINPGLISKVSSFVTPGMLSLTAIHKVPSRYPGRGRSVYPGMVQLSNFMTMSIRSHIESHKRYLKDIYHGNFESANKIRDFYDEYFSLLDTTAEFYIETLERVFIDQELPKGIMRYKGAKVNCAHIQDIPLFTVEGAKDNMVVPGQCQAAAGFCVNLPEAMKEHHLQEGVGHYGVFSGGHYRESIAPKVKAFIAKYHTAVKHA